MSVKITVTVDSSNNITCSPDPAPSGNGRNVPIQWDMATTSPSSTWTFTSDGITFKNPGGQFSGLNSVAKGKQFNCVDKNDVVGTYDYTVKLTNGTDTISVDPAIQNEGDK